MLDKDTVDPRCEFEIVDVLDRTLCLRLPVPFPFPFFLFWMVVMCLFAVLNITRYITIRAAMMTSTCTTRISRYEMFTMSSILHPITGLQVFHHKGAGKVRKMEYTTNKKHTKCTRAGLMSRL